MFQRIVLIFLLFLSFYSNAVTYPPALPNFAAGWYYRAHFGTTTQCAASKAANLTNFPQYLWECQGTDLFSHTKSCLTGFHYAAETKTCDVDPPSCEPPTILYFLPDSQAQICVDPCLTGTRVLATGECIQTQCPPDEFLNLATQTCVLSCPPGTVQNMVTMQCGQDGTPNDCSTSPLLNSHWNDILQRCTCPIGTIQRNYNGISSCDVPPECSSETSTDFIGYFGNPPVPVCSQAGWCPAGQTGGFVNGVYTCVNDVWDCPAGSVPVNGVCTPLSQEATNTTSNTTTTTNTTSNGDGTTTTTTTTTTNTTNTSTSGGGAGQSSSTTTTTIIRDAEGNIVSQTTETSETQTEEPEEEIQDKSYPAGEVHSYYQSSYTQGLSGVMDSHFTALNNSQASSFLNSFTGLPDSGSCPSFVFNFNLGVLGNFGSQSLPPDLFCYVFPIIRIFLIITSILFARRMVFGG